MKKDYSLEALGLLDSSIDLGLLNIVELAASMLGGSISFTSLIEHHKSRQYLPAFVGLPIELEIARQTSIEESICKFVQQSQKPIVIADLQDDERTKDNPLVHRYDLRSYIGTPIHSVSGRIIGALCCMDNKPGQWGQHDAALMEKLALCVDDVIRAKASALEEQKAKKAYMQLAEARSGFVAHMSHEIRTPLTGLVGSIRLLSSMGIPGRTGELVALLNRSTERLLDVVDDTLQLAKFDAGHFKRFDEPCNLSELSRDIIASYQSVANSKPIALTLNDNLEGKTHLCDRSAITSIVHNLFGNAVKFTEKGSAGIDLSEDPNGQVVISIKDTGIGIPEEYHEIIFQEFEQAGPTIARKYGGTGLGPVDVQDSYLV